MRLGTSGLPGRRGGGRLDPVVGDGDEGDVRRAAAPHVALDAVVPSRGPVGHGVRARVVLVACVAPGLPERRGLVERARVRIVAARAGERPLRLAEAGARDHAVGVREQEHLVGGDRLRHEVDVRSVERLTRAIREVGLVGAEDEVARLVALRADVELADG